MRFQPTSMEGVLLIDLELHIDERGYFARTWCREEFGRQGLPTQIAQCSISYNARRGTVRGMHWQTEPYAEAKLVRCVRGAIYDVVVDLRPDSATHGQWFSCELSATNNRLLFVPAGLAHGFQTLSDDTEINYFISESLHQECARGLRWNDPRFAIHWPLDVTVISARDRNFPDYQP